mmetsp:Transcript_50715/g.122338  ORF Transcript_50715/g.122338 Transcript_50715/m.122338 type:complete len:513 (-) Transcript_50715:47-1585(-)
MKLFIRQYEEDPTTATTTATPSVDSKDDTSDRNSVVSEEVVVLNSENGRWEFSSSSGTRAPVSSSSFSFSLSSPRKVVQQLFLPIGYPHSVDSTYLTYQLYDGLQGLCSYWRGVVSAQAVFQASGVGDANRTAFSAAMAWALRDGTGMIGGLLYSYIASHYFDVYVKEFRLILADCINDVALTLDLIAPYFGPVYSVYILTLSTMGKTICGITAGATKGRITHHFSRQNGNMADLTAKESTQETLVSLVGMVGGVWVARILNDAPPILTWLLFGLLTVIHVWANYRGVALLKLDTLNPERTRVLFRKLIDVMTNNTIKESSERKHNGMENVKDAVTQIPTPNDLEESMMSSIQNLVFPSIRVARVFQPEHYFTDTEGVWCSLFDFDEDSNKSTTARDLKYIFAIHTYNKFSTNSTVVTIWLKVGATTKDELQAFVHAMLLQAIMRREDQRQVQKSPSKDHMNKLFRRTSKHIHDLFGEGIEFMDRLSSLGWDLSRLYLGYSLRRLYIEDKDK